MKKNTNNFETILNHAMKAATCPSEAWRMGDKYFLAAEEEAYKKLSEDELSVLIHSAMELQKENGMLYLFEDPEMPGDARVDIIHKPSYAIAAVAIYAYCNAPEIFDETLDRFFCNLLEGTFRHGIIGHGFESEETVRRTLLMLCKAGARDFLDNHRDAYPIFASAIHRHIEQYCTLAKRIDEEQIIATTNGFSQDSINHLVKELVAYWNGNTHPVFVYGTLMEGEHAHSMLSSSEFGGYFQLKDYAMYDLGGYPGIRPCSGESVLGELYFVNSAMISRMDHYESEGSLYRRTPVTVCAGRNTVRAEAYVYNQDVTGCRKMREVWNAQDTDLVWYAGYGSNLSSERFSCYISGGTCAENGRTYAGSSDPTPALAMRRRTYPGELYFGNSSSSWNGCGVAFYDPSQKTECDFVHMKCYLINRQQLHDVMAQEGPSPNWYGRLVCLELDERGIPVYTLTSEIHRPENAPDPAYVGLIAGVLEKEFKLRKRQIRTYLHRANEKL